MLVQQHNNQVTTQLASSKKRFNKRAAIYMPYVFDIEKNWLAVRAFIGGGFGLEAVDLDELLLRNPSLD